MQDPENDRPESNAQEATYYLFENAVIKSNVY